MDAATLYYDLGSPYAYLAVARCERVLGRVTLQPVLVGAIFAHRGWGSWGVTDERDRNVAEVQRRAAAYGLPAVRWPAGWPNNTLSAMRMAVWALLVVAPPMRSGVVKPSRSSSPATKVISSSDGVISPESPIRSA